MDDILQKHVPYIGTVEGTDIKSLSNQVFSELLDSMIADLFPDSETFLKEYEYQTGTTQTTGGGREGTGTLYDPVYETVDREISKLSEYFDDEFFDALTPDEGTRWDAFVEFAGVVQETDDFVAEFTRRIEELGQSSVDAFEQIQLVSGVLAEMDSAVDAISNGTIINQIDTLIDTWNAYIDVMAEAQATAEQLTKAEEKRNLVVGANVLGVSVESIYTGLQSDKDVGELIGEAIGQLMLEQEAVSLFEEITPVLKAAGQAFIDTEGDIDAVTEILTENGIEWEAAAEAIQGTTEALADYVREAELMVAEIIQGGLTASQMFEQWGIVNQDAVSLFEEIITDGISTDELSSMVDAFSELGLKGESLTTVIGHLTGRFVDAADELESILSGIGEASDDLPTTENNNKTAEEAFLESLTSFLNYPDLSDIMTGENQTIFDEDAYNKAIEEAAASSGEPDYSGYLSQLDAWLSDLTSSVGDVSGYVIPDSSAESLVESLYSKYMGKSGIGDDPSQIDQSGYDFWVDTIKSAEYTYQEMHDMFAEAVKNSLTGSESTIENHFANIGESAGLALYNSIADIDPEDFMTVISGEGPTSSQEDISAALDMLDQFNSSNIMDNYQDFIDTLGQIKDELGESVLYDIFGEGVEDMIRTLNSAYDDYTSDSGDSDYDYTGTETDYQDQIDSIVDSIEYALATMDMSDLEKTLYDINQQASDWTASLEEYGAATEENIALIGEWTKAQEEAAQAAYSADLLNQILDLENQYFSLLGDEVALKEVINAQRQIELETLDESLRDLQMWVWELEDSQVALDESKSVLESLVDEEWDLINARKAAKESIESFIDSLYGSDRVPVQSMEYFEGRYAELLAEAQNATTAEEISSSVSNLTSFVNDYLDFASDYGGNYSTLFNSIVSDLENLSDTMYDVSDSEIDYLEDIESILGNIEESSIGIEEALNNYLTAQADAEEITFDEEGYYQSILNQLAALGSEYEDWAKDFNDIWADAAEDLWGSTDPNNPTDPTNPTDPVYDILDSEELQEFLSQYRNEIDQLWNEFLHYDFDTKTLSLPELGLEGLSYEEMMSALYADMEKYIEQLGLDTAGLEGYASGGIASGPDSGYLAMMHGTEAVIPLNNGSIPVQIQGGGQGDIQVIVKIGNRELHDITTEVINTNPQTQRAVRRVANA
jgi:hypothetical protein